MRVVLVAIFLMGVLLGMPGAQSRVEFMADPVYVRVGDIDKPLLILPSVADSAMLCAVVGSDVSDRCITVGALRAQLRAKP